MSAEKAKEKKSGAADGGLSLDQFVAKHLPSEESLELGARLSELRKAMREYRKEYGHLKVLMKECMEAVEPMRPVAMEYRAPKKRRVTRVCTVVEHVTDLHMGAVQRPDEIEGFRDFSPEVLREGMKGFGESIVEWTEYHRYAHRLDEVVVLVTGDLVSGDIHDDLRVTNAWPVPVQAVEAARLLAEHVGGLARHFRRVRVEYVLADNHGRLTKRPQAKEEGLNNWNYVIGSYLQAWLREQKNVEVNLYPGYEATVEVNGRRYLILHGHGIKGWAGFPWYGVERRVAKEAMVRMHMPDRYKYHRVVLGHFHTPLEHPWYLVGGSASGTDALDHKEGRYSKPCQSAWMVHPEHGEFDRTNFRLGE